MNFDETLDRIIEYLEALVRILFIILPWCIE